MTAFAPLCPRLLVDVDTMAVDEALRLPSELPS